MNIMEMGLQSAQLIKLTKDIEGEADITLFPTVFFEYPNINELVAYFCAEFGSPFMNLLNVKPRSVIQSARRGDSV